MALRGPQTTQKGNIMVLIIRALVKAIRNYKATHQQVARQQ
jgi:hypothetical protein